MRDGDACVGKQIVDVMSLAVLSCLEVYDERLLVQRMEQEMIEKYFEEYGIKIEAGVAIACEEIEVVLGGVNKLGEIRQHLIAEEPAVSGVFVIEDGVEGFGVGRVVVDFLAFFGAYDKAAINGHKRKNKQIADLFGLVYKS